jgi:hypothetical protein
LEQELRAWTLFVQADGMSDAEYSFAHTQVFSLHLGSSKTYRLIDFYDLILMTPSPDSQSQRPIAADV